MTIKGENEKEICLVVFDCADSNEEKKTMLHLCIFKAYIIN